MLIICLQSIKTTTFKDVETQLLQSRRFEDVRLKLKCNYCHYCALVQKLELSEEIFQFHSQVQACVLRARENPRLKCLNILLITQKCHRVCQYT